MAIRAVMSGRKAANRAPKAMPSTMRASTIPAPVLEELPCASAASMSWPPERHLQVGVVSGLGRVDHSAPPPFWARPGSAR